jgi:nicotinamide mononucleotide adenylyltransferase
MKLKELFESEAKNLVVILPGRFQPPHPGHLHGYLQLVNKFGSNNVYITMSEKTNPKTSPLLYDERKEILTKLLGIPADKIVQVTKQYNVNELVKNMNLSDDTAVIFAVCKKDAAERQFTTKTKKDGSPSYMKKYNKEEPLESYKDHSYIVEYPTTKFELNGKKIKSASQIRKIFKNLNTTQKKKLFKSIYGNSDERIFHTFMQKLAIR